MFVQETPARPQQRGAEIRKRVTPVAIGARIRVAGPGPKEAAPFMASCSDIVVIGRVKWIEGSKHTGKDNHAWYRLDAHPLRSRDHRPLRRRGAA